METRGEAASEGEPSLQTERMSDGQLASLVWCRVGPTDGSGNWQVHLLITYCMPGTLLGTLVASSCFPVLKLGLAIMS